MKKPELLPADHPDAVATDEVIVVLMWHLGDVLNATSLLPDLRARHQRRLTFATTRACAPILAHHPGLSRIRIVDKDVPRGLLSMEMWQEAASIHERLFTGAEKVYNLHMPVPMKQIPHHIIEVWGRAIGIDKGADALKTQYFPDPSVTGMSREKPYFVLGNGGNAGPKRWPAPRWRRVVSWLRATYPETDLVQLGVPGDPLLDTVEDVRGTSIDDSYRLLQNARGCLTNDSFLAHLASAAGCSTSVIFGPTCPAHYRPLGPGGATALGGHGYRTMCGRNLCRLLPGRTPCLAFPSARQVIGSLTRSLLPATVTANDSANDSRNLPDAD